MSRARSRAEESLPASDRAFRELTTMVSQGRSWSGRERNSCFLNTGGGGFATISAVSGLDFPDDGRAVAVTDWDQDGYLDLWISNRNAPRLRLLRNDAPREGPGASGFLALRLVGNGSTTNRDAIGARVEVEAAGLPGKLWKTLRAGEGFLAQSSKWMHFGLGGAKQIERVIVRWPGRGAEEFRGLEANRRYELVQGSGRAAEWMRPAKASALSPSEPELPAAEGTARIPLVTLISFPRLSYEDWSRARLPLAAAPGRHLLLNLWSGTCAPCLAELKEIMEKEREIRAAGVDVVALTVDGLGGDGSSPAAAREAMERLHFPFPAGRAGAPLVRMLQYLHDGLIALHRPLPVPVSFLVDPQGRLSAIYKGRLQVADLLKDLGHSGGSRLERWRRAAPLGGRAIEHELVERAAAMEETKGRFQLALDLERGGLLEEARIEYLEVVRLRPDFAEAHNNLGLLLAKTGDTQGALARLEQALRLRPDFAEAHFNLGLVLEKEGKLEAARARYGEALRLRPDYPGAHNALGLALAKEGKIAGARGEFEAEIRLHPDSADAHNHLGLTLFDLKEERAAEAEFQSALRLEPDHADARNNLGVLFKRQGKLEEAAAEYEHAIRVQPDFAEAHNNLGAVRLYQGKLVQARTSFERALEIRPDFAAARQNLERAHAQEAGKGAGR